MTLFMKVKDFFWGIVTLLVWYLFAYYALYAIKNPVDLRTASVTLLALGLLGTLSCPWFQHTPAWKSLLGRRCHHEDKKSCCKDTEHEA